MASTRLAFLSEGRWPICRPSKTPRARAAARPDFTRSRMRLSASDLTLHFLDKPPQLQHQATWKRRNASLRAVAAGNRLLGLQADKAGRQITGWLRDTLMRRAIAPRLSRPTRWKVFLPMSRPIVATGSGDC